MSQLGDHLARVLAQRQGRNDENSDASTDTSDRLRRVIASLADVDPEQVKPEDDLERDYHFDRLSLLELAVKVETITGARTSDEETFQGCTVADVLAYGSETESTPGIRPGDAGDEHR